MNFNTPDAVVIVRKEAAYVTVALNKLQDSSKIKSVAWRVIQEAFDGYAATQKVALSTQHGNREYFLWLHTSDGYQLTCINTLEQSVTIDIKIETQTTQSPQITTPLTHHASLRYYRVALLAEDLFDAYRNAYMCLECLISSESPRQKKIPGKGKESEKDWLKRVLSSQLSAALPSLDIDTFVDEIYKGRLLVFHSKVDEIFYPPFCEEREKIQVLLNNLLIWLSNLLRYKFGSCVTGREASFLQAVVDGMGRVYFQFDKLIFKHQERYVPITATTEVI